METLTNMELIEIHGGGWDWGDFFQGVGVGLGIAAAVALTGGMPLAAGAAFGWAGAGINLLTLLLGD